MDDRKLLETVLEHYKNLHVKIEILEMRKFAPGVIAVFDSVGEIDIYFDMERWTFTHPEIWDWPPKLTVGYDPGPALVQLAKDNVGLLEGASHQPRLNSFAGMMWMARSELKSTDISWYDTPKEIGL